MGTLVARGPSLQGVDEQPVPKLSRPPEDDFTLPFPERSETMSARLDPSEREPTGDLDRTDPETETAEAPRPTPAPRAKSVPNLARARWGSDTDEDTSPAMVPPSTRQARQEAADEEPSRTIPRPTALSSMPMGREETLSGHLEAVPADEGSENTLGAHLVESREDTVGSLLVEATRAQMRNEETLGAHLVEAPRKKQGRRMPPAPKGSRKPPPRRSNLDNVPPAEVWTRNASEWRTAGRLLPGQRTKVQEGWVELDDSGRLLVHPGPEMSGTATLVNGRTVEISRNSQRVRLPPGSSVILRGPGHGLYVRADPPSPGR